MTITVENPVRTVQICAWCPPGQVRFLSPVLLRPGETLEVLGDMGSLKVQRIRARFEGQVREIEISHGICGECLKLAKRSQ